MITQRDSEIIASRSTEELSAFRKKLELDPTPRSRELRDEIGRIILSRLRDRNTTAWLLEKQAIPDLEEETTKRKRPKDKSRRG